MQPVLDAINLLQRVAFTINQPVLDFILKNYKTPAPDGLKPPVWQQKKFQEWQEATAARVMFHRDMVTAEAMACVERFWVPLNIDFRGRVYGIPHFNFQRDDHIRALFLFADGAPIGEDGLKWLKAHVARTAKGNKWSDVKKPGKFDFDGRVAWTDANLPTLRRIGEAVLNGDDPATMASYRNLPTRLIGPFRRWCRGRSPFCTTLNIWPRFAPRRAYLCVGRRRLAFRLSTLITRL